MAALDRGEPAREARPNRLLTLLGVVWLLLAAAILYFQYGSVTPVAVEWRTETEIDTAGFNLYRATSEDGEFIKINEQLIPGKGSAVSGASYSIVDESADARQTYYYQLEEVELDNTTARQPVFVHTAETIAWWPPLAAGLSLLAGLFLLFRAFQ